MRKYAIILGNLGNTCDRFCRSYKENPSSIQMLKDARSIEDVTGIELVGTWDVSPDNAKEMKIALNDLGFDCVSIIPDLFSDSSWKNGSLTAKDGNIRKLAKDYLRQMCDVALEMDCEIINLWPGQDGYDYPLQSDMLNQRKWLTENIAEVASDYPSLKFALEYKAKEPRTHSYLARMADTLLVCSWTGLENVGVTIDTGHAFLGGENVAESIVLAKQAGDKLFHMHFNDNYKEWDDDMIVGSIHSIDYIELLYWLDECGYDGWLSMDQYPYREDAAGAISESIRWVQGFDNLVIENRNEIKTRISEGDAVKTSAFLRGMLFH